MSSHINSVASIQKPTGNSIKSWPDAERPREKLLQRGADALSDAELLAIFLRTGTRGKNAVELARELLQAFGGLRQLLNADQHEFCAHHGLGTAKYVQLQAVMEMAKRELQQALSNKDVLSSPQTTRQYLRSQLRGLNTEQFGCLFLDNQHQVIRWQVLFYGTVNSAAVYPRVIAAEALKHHAAAVIVAHNHPSGISEPSAADQQITAQIQKALQTLDIRLLDHFIIGEGEPTSMAELGML